MDFDTLFNHLDDTTLAQLEQEFRLSTHRAKPASGSTERLSVTNDFERLIRFAEPLVSKYDDISSAEWELSQIGWIRQVSSALKRGKIGEELVTAWAHSEGLTVAGRSHRGHDCRVDGLKLEVKTSLRWNNDRFVFFGLRDFDYDAVALLGLEPDNVRLWIVPKLLIWRRAREQLRSAGALNSKWLAFDADEPPSWLAPWGGSFAQARLALPAAAAYNHETISELPLPRHDSPDDQAWLALATQIDWPWRSSPHDHFPHATDGTADHQVQPQQQLQHHHQ
jgi:hypothetical protein